MAAYTAIISLMQDLEQLLKSYQLIFGSERVSGDLTDPYGSQQVFCPFSKKNIEIIYHSVTLMDSFLRDSSGVTYDRGLMNQQLEKRIRDAAYRAGNLVNLWSALCHPDPESVFGRVNGGDTTLTKIAEEMHDLDSAHSAGKSMRQPIRAENVEAKLVGIEKYLEGMLALITGDPPKLKVLAVIGKPGIGKTTLSKKLYDSRSVMNHFNLRVWVTISRKYQIREILIGILCCATDDMREISGKSDRELREQVFGILMHRRYFIVLDDMRDAKAWDDLKTTFPDTGNGSRIVLTSRIMDLAFLSIHDIPIHLLDQLNALQSWELFGSKVFVLETYTPELKLIAEKIVCKCQGVPLAIVAAGGLLSNLEMRLDVWKKVVRSIGKGGYLLKPLKIGSRPRVMKASLNCENILALSYNHLPDQLKKCILSMGYLPEGCEIPAKKLMRLWVAEGFIGPHTVKSLEEVAEDYLKDLVARSLVMVRRRSSDGRIKTCYIHDLIRKRCLRESKKQQFLRIINPLHYNHGERKFSLTETEIAQDIESINGELKKIHDERKFQNLEAASSKGKSFTSLSSSRRIPNAEVKLVGLEEDLVTLLDSLTGHPSQLKVLSIIGMAGIGKTTFSRKLYDSLLSMHHFYVRVWITVSQQYHLRELLLGILHCITNSSDETHGKSNEELREQVYRSLKCKRYLIVLDDIWDTKVWDYLKRTFPDDKIGSRIVLTSRLRDVADHASQDTPPHHLRCLTKYESWELLSLKIFGDESCPVELMEIGKQIAYKCQGLPLAIVVVGGLLSKMNERLDVWEEVAQHVGSLVMTEAEHCENILALSYNHLPDCLKACFLYLGIFPEDHEISVKKLIWLWVAEGFIRPHMVKSLEQVAEEYLEDLIARNLVMMRRKSSDGKIRTCYIHDLMRELCLRECKKQNFLHVINNSGQLPPENLGDEFDPCFPRPDPRRLSFHSSIQKYFKKTSLVYTHSVLCFEKISVSDPQGYLGMDFKLLKVLDIININLLVIPSEILYLIHLKFLALTIQNYISMVCLSELLNLQTLIIDCEWDGQLPRGFWDMLELRHFHLKRICLPYSQMIEFQSPSTSILGVLDVELPFRVLNNLQSLSTIRPISCTRIILQSMPNLKKLGIHEFEEDNRFRGWFRNLVHLQELEKLKYVFSNPFTSSALKPDRLPSWGSFPPKLVKLTLSGTSLPWEDILQLSMLPKLEVLKLRNYAFSGAIWKSNEGGFLCLKFLLIGSTDLEIWEADGTPFPKLEHLVLRHCRSLEKIPREICEAPLLENIELHYCKDSAVKSARDLQQEQLSVGNETLTICITEG